jgi:hypothetical protein
MVNSFKLTEALALFKKKIMQLIVIYDMIIGTKTSHHGLNFVGYRRATYVPIQNDAIM